MKFVQKNIYIAKQKRMTSDHTKVKYQVVKEKHDQVKERKNGCQVSWNKMDAKWDSEVLYKKNARFHFTKRKWQVSIKMSRRVSECTRILAMELREKEAKSSYKFSNYVW